jgi:hypothetical protein
VVPFFKYIFWNDIRLGRFEVFLQASFKIMDLELRI